MGVMGSPSVPLSYSLGADTGNCFGFGEFL